MKKLTFPREHILNVRSALEHQRKYEVVTKIEFDEESVSFVLIAFTLKTFGPWHKPLLCALKPEDENEGALVVKYLPIYRNMFGQHIARTSGAKEEDKFYRYMSKLIKTRISVNEPSDNESDT